MPGNLKRGGRRNFLFPFPLKISVKTKKKVFTSFDVQFTPQNQVKTPPKKKVIASSDVLFHCSADWRYIPAYISAGGGRGPSAPPPGMPLQRTHAIYNFFGPCTCCLHLAGPTIRNYGPRLDLMGWKGSR